MVHNIFTGNTDAHARDTDIPDGRLTANRRRRRWRKTDRARAWDRARLSRPSAFADPPQRLSAIADVVPVQRSVMRRRAVHVPYPSVDDGFRAAKHRRTRCLHVVVLDPRISRRRYRGQTWTTGRSRGTNHESRFPGIGAVGVSFPRSGASNRVAHPSPTAPSLPGDRRRGRSVDNPARRCELIRREPTATVGVEAERVVHGLSTVAVPQSQERRWVGGGQRARRATRFRISWDGRAPWSRYPPGTSAGSISPICRQPMSSSHVPASATSRTRPGSAYRPAGGDLPRQPSNHKPRTRPVQHHRRNPFPSLTVVLAHVQQHVRQRPANLRRRPLHHVVEALLQHRAASSERPVHAPREARADALHAVRQPDLAGRLHDQVHVVVVADAQGDEDRTIPGNAFAGAVRHPGAVLAGPTRAGARTAAAGRSEFEGGLFGISAAGLLHWGHRRGTAEVHRIGRCTVYVNSISCERGRCRERAGASDATADGWQRTGTERRSDQVNRAMFRLGRVSVEAVTRVPGVSPGLGFDRHG